MHAVTDAALARRSSRVFGMLLIAALLVAVPVFAASASTEHSVAPAVSQGQPTPTGDLPSVVRVTLPGGGYCTGTVVAPTWVMTAAHCVPTGSPTNVRVHIGGDRLDAFRQEIDVARVVVHPDYSGFLRSDVALLGLSRGTSAPAQPLALQGAPDPVGTDALLAGWGLMSDTQESDRLRSGTVPVLDNSGCFTRYGTNAYQSSTNLCAGGQTVGACPGDSGGPLMVRRGGELVQYGITSFGSAFTCQNFTYNGYVAVAAFRDWIDSVLQHRGDGSNVFTDVRTNSAHFESVEAVAAADITSGFDNGTFRAEQTVTRAQMASFLFRAAPIRSGSTVRFDDVPGDHPHASTITAVASAGIAGGFGDGTYRPSIDVTRGQMATFLARTLELEDPRTGDFPDTRGHNHAASIRAISAAGIAGGFGDGNYRPNDSVTRGQMATFLYRGFLAE